MKKQLLPLITLLFISLSPYSMTGQTTIASSGISVNNGSASPPPAGISFNVVNNNGGPIVVTAIGATVATSNVMELWYSTTSLTGATGPIVSTNTAWNHVATLNSVATTGTIIYLAD